MRTRRFVPSAMLVLALSGTAGFALSHLTLGAGLGFPLAALVVVAGFLGAGRLVDRTARFWARWILRTSGTPVRLEGVEHLPADRPHIIAANHRSWYDIFALVAYTPKRYRFVAKKELARIPLFGTAWKVAGHISINRQDRKAAIQSLNRAGELMREDNSAIIIFPEGTRSLDGRMLPFKKGAFMLGLHTGVPIVPTALVGTFDIMQKGGWRIRPRPITIRFGEPVDPRRYDEETRDALVDEVRARIERLLGEAVGDRARRAS
jgi:1-acyl-sn-glycerol-3-phosphate acyltransferase